MDECPGHVAGGRGWKDLVLLFCLPARPKSKRQHSELNQVLLVYNLQARFSVFKLSLQRAVYLRNTGDTTVEKIDAPTEVCDPKEVTAAWQ